MSGAGGVRGAGGDFELTGDELRAVARYAVESAEEVLPVFEAAVAGDPRPRAAVAAAWEFARGADRTRLQRVTALEAHRAAKEAPTEAARLAARAAGDAAAAAYLHPLAQATQVGHILRAAACAARVAELGTGAADPGGAGTGEDPAAGLAHLEAARLRASPTVVAVLRRYPPAPTGRNRLAALMSHLDTALRADG
ncbi:putative immunity protein [Streptomyces sp. NPDC097619]|uniref:putative immunity protein n=1 Tax=Streptomyces sp. NPDC097619 TaxID=3157228 RepID=UPI0033247E74